GRSLSRDRHRIRDRLRGIKESYDDTYSSHGTRTKCKDRSRDRNHSRNVKRWRESESPPSRGLENSTNPFTPRIRNFKSSRKTRMPNNVKTYDETGDPEDHLKIFQVAAQVERWAMPTWCHMFNSTLIGAARVWFDELPPESIDGYKGPKAAFLAYFMQQKKRMKKAPECMRIFGFMHGVNNPELTKRLNEHVPKTVEEMMTATTVFIWGEIAAASKKKVHTPWKSQDQTPKEIFAAESRRFKPPPPIVTPVEKRSNNKFYEFHNDKGHSTDEFVQLRKQIEELSFARVKEITFPPLTANKGTEGALVIEAEIGGHAVHRIYVDGGSSMKVLYEHYFNRLWPEIKSQMVSTTTLLTGFSGETIWPLGQLRILVTIGDTEHYTKACMNFMIVRSPSPYNGIIGRPRIREIQAVPSTAHGILKFSVNGEIVTIRSTILTPTECATIAAIPKDSAKKAEAMILKWPYTLTFRTKRLLLEERYRQNHEHNYAHS
nr:hypothetical protein [Tanacetum cinerariifolium]